MKLLVISHGDFAAGISSTLKNFFGIDNVYSACVTQEHGTKDLLDRVEGFMDSWKEEQVVICSDLKSGSANQAVLPFRNRPNTFLISGMNLSLLLQLAMENEISEERIREIIDAAVEDMVFINDLPLNTSDEDDE